MKNDAYIKLIDETDAAYVDLDTFGITLIRGWREALLTSSRLEDGERIIAHPKNVKKDKRDVSLSFFLEGSSQEDYLIKYGSFLDKIAYSGQFCLKVPVPPFLNLFIRSVRNSEIMV